MSSEERYFFNNINKKIYNNKKYDKRKIWKYLEWMENLMDKNIDIFVYLFKMAMKYASEEILLS